MSDATSHRQERSTKTGLSAFVIVMNMLWKQTATMAGVSSVPQLLEGFFHSAMKSWVCTFCIQWYGQNISRTFKPCVKCPAQFTVLGSAYSCLLSRNSVSALLINGFKNCVEINTEQGHDLAFFKLCCHTFYACHCQMGEKSFQLSTKYSRQHLQFPEILCIPSCCSTNVHH